MLISLTIIITEEGDSVTLVPCGGKGAGKSTFIRYMCNRLLQRSVCLLPFCLLLFFSDLPLYVLDVDIGQTEFTPSGCMSLVKVTKPLLDLPWAHQQADFDFSYFYGGVSPADDMSKYKVRAFLYFRPVFRESSNVY